MPELPEVELVRQYISRVCHYKIHSYKSSDYTLRYPSNLDKLRTPNAIKSIERHGKLLVLFLDTGYICIHLGMTGMLRLRSPKALPYKHEHIVLSLLGDDNCLDLVYVDPRRFGYVVIQENSPILKGRDGLKNDITPEYLEPYVRKSSTCIKNFLMNQDVIAGIGNIYASELLFLARVSPYRPTKSLTSSELKALADNVLPMFKSALASEGSTIQSFITPEGHVGQYKHLVYQARRCSTCLGPIKRTILNQRATYHCPLCQV